jgi:hypothetical protein
MIDAATDINSSEKTLLHYDNHVNLHALGVSEDVLERAYRERAIEYERKRVAIYRNHTLAPAQMATADAELWNSVEGSSDPANNVIKAWDKNNWIAYISDVRERAEAMRADLRALLNVLQTRNGARDFPGVWRTAVKDPFGGEVQYQKTLRGFTVFCTDPGTIVAVSKPTIDPAIPPRREKISLNFPALAL